MRTTTSALVLLFLACVPLQTRADGITGPDTATAAALAEQYAVREVPIEGEIGEDWTQTVPVDSTRSEGRK